jgi:hypothetical protein
VTTALLGTHAADLATTVARTHAVNPIARAFNSYKLVITNQSQSVALLVKADTAAEFVSVAPELTLELIDPITVTLKTEAGTAPWAAEIQEVVGQVDSLPELPPPQPEPEP